VWKSIVTDAAGAALSENLMQQVADDVNDTSGEMPDIILSESTQRRKFYALLTSQKRTTDVLNLKGGFKALTFDDNIPVVVDRFLPIDSMYFLNRNHLFLAEQTDWDWADQDGAVLSRVAGKAEFEAFLYKYANFVTDMRNSNGRLKGLATA
jgi:hypothetical protein